jgi:methionine--tRNA ligase beta chain
MINCEDWKKVELKVAKIISAETIEGSEKLLRLSVSLGDEERQVIAGIGKSYSSESLIGKQIVIVANLEPRSLMGLESQGMIVAATASDGKPVIITPENPVAEGTILS